MALSFKIPGLKRRPEPGVLVSAGVHAALLVAVLATYSMPTFPEAQEGIAVEVVTDTPVSEITKGEKEAKAVVSPKPRADRVAEKVEERDPGEAKRDAPAPPKRPRDLQVADADETPPPPPLRPALEKPEPAPTPPARPDTAKADAAKAEAAKADAAKADAAKAQAAKQAAAKAEAEAVKREEMAELIRKEEAEAKEEAKAEAKAKAVADAKAKAKADAQAKAELAKAEAAKEAAKEAAEAKAEAEAQAKADAAAKAKAVADAKAKADAKAMADARAKLAAEAKARKQAEMADKFDAGDIRQLLSSKEPSASTGATGREVQRTASLGTVTGMAQRLNPGQRAALIGLLQGQIERCYSAPPGAQQGVVLPVLDIRLNVDGSLTTEPRIMRAGANSVDRSIADAAVRAVRRCAPYRIPAQYAPFYNDWKTINAEFELPVG